MRYRGYVIANASPCQHVRFAAYHVSSNCVSSVCARPSSIPPLVLITAFCDLSCKPTINVDCHRLSARPNASVSSILAMFDAFNAEHHHKTRKVQLEWLQSVSIQTMLSRCNKSTDKCLDAFAIIAAETQLSTGLSASLMPKMQDFTITQPVFQSPQQPFQSPQSAQVQPLP